MFVVSTIHQDTNRGKHSLAPISNVSRLHSWACREDQGKDHATKSTKSTCREEGLGRSLRSLLEQREESEC